MAPAQKPASPLRILRDAINHTILVKLKDGSEYIGKLEMTDNTMNLVLEDCEEVSEGKLKVKYGKVLIRGSQILFISIDYDIHGGSG